MALFRVDDKGKIKHIEVKQLRNEKELQKLCEANLEELFQARFIATEFPFSDDHAGRLDTLAIDFEGNPSSFLIYKRINLLVIVVLHDRISDNRCTSCPFMT